MADDYKTNPFPPISKGIAYVTARIEMLCTGIGFGYNIEDCEVRGGRNNNVIMFSYMPSLFSDPNRTPTSNTRKYCILRTSKEILTDSLGMACESTRRIVAVMHSYGEGGPRISPLPIPAILAYDETYNNPIDCPYIIQRRAAGEDLNEHYRILDLSIPATGPCDLRERLRISEETAKVIASTENRFPFGSYGSLIPGPKMLKSNMSFLGEKIDMRLRGPFVGSVQISGKLHHIDFIEGLANAWCERAESRSSPAEKRDLVKLGQIFDQMRNGGLLDQFDGVPTLWHPDLYPRNLIFDRSESGDFKLIAVVDWDDAMVLPRIMTRAPPSWLWDYHNLCSEDRATIRDHFYNCIESLIPGYRDDAEGREARLVRALYMYALRGPSYGHHSELSFRGLVNEWDIIGQEEMF